MAEPMVATHIKRKGFLMIEDSFERELKENANGETKTCRRGTPVLFSIGA